MPGWINRRACTSGSRPQASSRASTAAGGRSRRQAAAGVGMRQARRPAPARVRAEHEGSGRGEARILHHPCCAGRCRQRSLRRRRSWPALADMQQVPVGSVRRGARSALPGFPDAAACLAVPDFKPVLAAGRSNWSTPIASPPQRRLAPASRKYFSSFSSCRFVTAGRPRATQALSVLRSPIRQEY